MSKQNAKNKGRKEPKLAKNVAKSSLEIGEELNIEPRLRPAKTGSVSQNTSKPIKPRKNNKKFATLMSPTTSSVAQNLFYAQNQLIDITYIQKLSTFFLIL